MVIHANYAAASVTFPFLCYVLHIKDRHVNSQVAKLALTGGITGGTNGPQQIQLNFPQYFLNGNSCMTGEIENEAKRWFERILECSFQDLLAMWLPYMVLCATSFLILGFSKGCIATS